MTNFKHGGMEGQLGTAPNFLEPMSEDELREWEGEQMDEWRPIDSAPKDGTKVDLWLQAENMGWSDEWRVPDARFYDGEWWHPFGTDKRQLAQGFITHWRPIPEGPPKKP